MRKLFTAKPGKTTGLFLLLGIVALQWSFTTAVTGENRTAYLLTDTSTTPVVGKTVAAGNKRTSTSSNRTATSSKPVLASNLERETISFGSPTGEPESEVGSSVNRKKTVVVPKKATDATVVEAVSVKSGSAEKKNVERVNTNGGTASTKTDKKHIEGVNTNAGTANSKNAAAGKKTIDDATTTGTTTTGTKTTGTKKTTAKTASTASSKTLATTSSIGILSNKLIVFDSLHLKEAGLSKKVFTLALKGMSKLVTSRHIKDNLLAIVDYSQPSNKKRLYVIDLNNYQLLYKTYVAHGMNTGRQMAQYFSNKPSSNKSSLGFYVTGPAYQGTNGYSLKLTGVEKGINDRAMDRGIVIHGADYVCEGLIESQGFIGRSWGCPAVAPEVSQELIDLLKGGSCLFIYHPSEAYKAKSMMLK